MTHGHRRNGRFTGTYNSWRAMLERCRYARHPRFQEYGGRGIQVCDRWQGAGGFSRFLEDMGERPAGMTLDRIDVDGNYTPGNCRWATPILQRWNRRDMVRGPDPWAWDAPGVSGPQDAREMPF